MDCNHARLLLSFAYKKAELDTAEADALQAHLEQCPECEAAARSEQAVDEALGRAMNAVPVPGGLKGRVLDKLVSVRRPRIHPIIRWAAAAMILLSVGFGGYVLMFGRTEVGWEDLTSLMDYREFVEAVREPEKIEEWFRDQGVAMKAPRRFNYGLIRSFDIVTFKKRQVAKLVFARDDSGHVAIAEVYVLADKDFDFDRLRNELEQAKGQLPVSNLTVQASGSFLFLMIFQGGSLDPFLDLPSA
jgi:hypothetical protein